MIGLDTNVLVRYLTQDDPTQSRRANSVIDRAIAGSEQVHVDTVVLCELVWVLRSAYGYDRTTVADTLIKLLETGQLSVDDRDRLREATQRYAKGPGDFADHVIALRNRSAGCDTTLTFDRNHRKSDLFTLL
jgi:predicted nucleic-acid-binding protein